MSFINDSFMITSPVGQKLYSDVAKDLPIIDYHCHLDARDICMNELFRDITHVWLEGDHYKWRAMRANGVPEEKITGNASPEEKFQAWAETVECCFGNPLYHWTHLELDYYFGIKETLNGSNWRGIMDECNRQLKQENFRPKALIERSNIETLCTTDGPLDDLRFHRKIRADTSFKTRVLPTFRPDELFDTNPVSFNHFILRLGELTSLKMTSLSAFRLALMQRVDYFHLAGCRISDHGLQSLEYVHVDEKTFEKLLARRLGGAALNKQETVAWNSAVLVMLADIYHQYDWSVQIHFGAIRNNNTRQYNHAGINSGFDSVADQSEVAANLNGLLNAMDIQGHLPRVIIYNLNAACNDVVASAVANFQSGNNGVRSPVQFGAGWWFNDTRRGMVNQLSCLADQGVLMNFIGMLTDSRSFVSCTRHDYFRRILCDLIGHWVDNGEVPNDRGILERMIKNISVENARRYFNF